MFPDKQKLTNTDQIRHIRGIDQFKFEEEVVPSLVGTSWETRWESIRKRLFVKHDPSLGEYRQCELENYPRAALVTALYQPQLANFTDGVEAELMNDENESNKGFRLAVVNYVLGILIHPVEDGNGQSFRLLALSYIHEHCPEYLTDYFPIKYSSDAHETKLKTLFDDGISGVKIHPPPVETVTSLEDQKLLSAFEKIENIDTILSSEINSIPQADRGLWMDQRRDQLAYDIAKEIELTPEMVDSIGYSLPDRAVTAYIKGILTEHYPGYIFEPGPNKADKKTYLLTMALCTRNGLAFLKNYIDTGSSKVDSENIPNGNILYRLLADSESKMREALVNEPLGLHQEIYKEQLLKQF